MLEALNLSKADKDALGEKHGKELAAAQAKLAKAMTAKMGDAMGGD